MDWQVFSQQMMVQGNVIFWETKQVLSRDFLREKCLQCLFYYKVITFLLSFTLSAYFVFLLKNIIGSVSENPHAIHKVSKNIVDKNR